MSKSDTRTFATVQEKENALNEDIDDVAEILANKLYLDEGFFIYMLDDDVTKSFKENEVKEELIRSGKAKKRFCRIISFFYERPEFMELMNKKPEEICYDKTLLKKDPKNGVVLVFDKKSMEKLNNKLYQVIQDWKENSKRERVPFFREFRILKDPSKERFLVSLRCGNCGLKKRLLYSCKECLSIRFCSRQCKDTSRYTTHTPTECNLIRSRANFG